MTLHIESGHPVIGDVAKVDGNFVRFVTDTGRVLFEVRIASDRSIEVRAIEMTKIDGKLFDARVLVSPAYSNSVIISTAQYEEPAKKATIGSTGK